MREHDSLKGMALAQTLGEPEIVGRLLANRGIDLEDVASFLNPTIRHFMPDPSHLKDLDHSVTRVIQALRQKEKIALFGDYDVDGATASALLFHLLKALGGSPRIYIPDRLEEGYGPNLPAFRQLKSEGVQVILTVDCGTTAFDVLEEAARIGLDVIVIDHHVAEPKLPKAWGVVNPNRIDQESPLKHLAAVGLSFVFAAALVRALRRENFFQNRPEPDLLSYLDLVALGTVCDVVELKGLNRAFVSQGLKILARRQNDGLKALADEAGLQEKASVYHLGFLIGPRINAGGRVGKASLGAELLTSQDPSRCASIARDLSLYNQERQAIEQQVLEEAILQAEKSVHPVILVSSEGWHPGVIGIVAGRLKERFHRPAIVIGFEEGGVGKGSGRSVPGLDLGSLVHAARQKGLLEGGGGHAMAAGLVVRREQMDALQEFLNERCRTSEVDLTPSLTADGFLSLRAATPDLLVKLERLAPFGQGNPSPRFIFPDLKIGKADVVGGTHIRCFLTTIGGGSLSGIAFRALDTPLGETLLHTKESLALLGSLKLDTWMDREKVSFIIEDGVPMHLLEKEALAS